MKKLLDSKFLFILALSIIVLIILGVGAFYLFDDSDAVFVKDGYVLNPLSAKSEKYFFDENTSYKENLNQMVVFDDVDKNEVKVLRESFLHYMDGSLSFLKNGAILDLDSIKGTDAVKFYNITSKSIINKNANGYVIETSGDDIGLKNFIGRISDNKYIVVGSLEAKIPGNEKNIAGDYFEIVYTDEGIVNIENKDIKYQVAAQGSYVYVGDIVIDLGDKKITKNNEDVMSITAITIDGNENIEIIPKAPDPEENGNGTGNGENNEPTGNPTTNDQDGNGGGTAGNDGTDAQDQAVLEELQVLLKEYDVDSTSVTVSFDILNAREDDSLTLKVTDLSTGRTINEVVNIANKREIPITLLSPENKYLFTVVNERNQDKYFQKIFETNSFGISLEKTYVTSNEIGYKINIDAGGNVKDARLMLKKFNETKDADQLETVATYQLKDIIDMTEGEHDGIIFSGLDSDTIYTAVLDSFSVASTNFNDIYNITLTSMTLKETPIFGDMQKEITNNSFKLYIDNVEDPDNAITGYTYTIYKANDTEFKNPVISPIVKANASPVEVKIGGGENELNVDTNYVYKVAIEYNDNEKYIEYMMDGSINLFKGKDPYVVIEAGDDLSYDRFEALIYLYDSSCLIDIPGKCDVSAYDDNDSIKVMVYQQGVMQQNEILLREYTGDELEFIPDGEDGAYKLDLKVNNLSRGTTYSIYVMAIRNDKPGEDFKPVLGTDENNTFKTKYLASFEAEWENEAGSRDVPIETSVKLKGIENDKAVSPDETIDIVKAVVFKLYDGEFNTNTADLADAKYIASSKPIVKSNDLSIAENFYNNAYHVTLETFGLTLEELEDLTGNEDGKLSPYYTIVMEAYYDYEMTEKNSVSISGKWNPYHINPELRNVILNDPTLTIDAIKKIRNDYFDNSLTAGLVVGYTLNADFDEDSFYKEGWHAQDINFYVYDDNGNRVKFYVVDDNKLKLVSYYQGHLGDQGFYILDIYMGYGVNDNNVMTRGNKYYVGYEIIYTVEGETDIPPYPSNNNPNVPARSGLYKSIDEEVGENNKAIKDQPKIKYAYIEKTTEDGNVTFKYQITDIDNALVKTDNENYIYYNINDEYKDKIKLTKGDSIEANGSVEADIPVYQGEFTLSGLTKGDGYTLFYRALLDNNSELVEKNIGKENRLYDGFYDAANYNFKFEVNPNLSNIDSTKNNKVTIKMLAEEEMLSRILSYKIRFSTPNVTDIVKEPWELVPCDDALEGETPRCYQVEYLELKRAGMKSEGNNTKLITVSVEAIYDNGLTGYGYEDKVGTDYPYMIMQENSTKEEIGKYHIINNKMLRKSAPGYPSGYYTFSINNGWLTYNSAYNPADKGTYELILSSEGRGVSSGIMNPKMVSVASMNSDDNKNKFSFSSITPMIKESSKISLINGARLYLNLSGADTEDICVENTGNNCNTGNGDRYLYVDIWNSENDADDNTKTPIDTIKIKLDNDNINGRYNTNDDLVNLIHDRTYYYTVYTYLNENGTKKKTRVFDQILKDRAKVYNFNTKKLLDIFDANKMSTQIIPNDDGAYNDKLLKTSITLNKYEDDIPFNFKLSYVLCDVDDLVCDLDNNILRKNINEEDESTKLTNQDNTVTIEDLVDITDNIANNEIEFGKDYLIKFYATYDTYGSNKEVVDKTVEMYQKNVLGDKTLSDIVFSVGRTADYITENNDYVIDLKISLSDDDRLLLNGKYYVELTDGNDNVVGNLQLVNDEGIYTIVASDNYNEYPIEAKDYQTVRIGGLDPDTLYTVKVFGYPYIGETDKPIVSGEEGNGYLVYSSNNYGVAFGNSVLYTYDASAENVVVANFGYGSHLKDNTNIIDVTYTIKRDGSSLPPYSETLKIGEDIWFEQYAGTENLIMKFNIDKTKFEINKGFQYTFTTSYTVYDPVNDRYGVIDYTIYPSLSYSIGDFTNNS